MYALRFHASRVTLNDKQFIGNMMASDSDYFNVDICGLASIEFSLRHLKDAKPWGTLSDGEIRIANPDGRFITISNVTNGPDDQFISGGPYTVWVRWNKPQATVDEYRAALKAQRESTGKRRAGRSSCRYQIKRPRADRPGIGPRTRPLDHRLRRARTSQERFIRDE